MKKMNPLPTIDYQQELNDLSKMESGEIDLHLIEKALQLENEKKKKRIGQNNFHCKYFK